jgi:hypothetical protein
LSCEEAHSAQTVTSRVLRLNGDHYHE